MIEANRSMLQILFVAARPLDVQLPPHIKKILSEGLSEEDGCWFLAACKRGTVGSIEQFGDRTGLEMAINGIHIDSFDLPLFDAAALLKQGLVYVDELRQLLELKGVFKIILSLRKTKLDDQPDHLTCHVSFHKVRSGEPYGVTDDLEAYLSEAVLVFTTSKQNGRN